MDHRKANLIKAMVKVGAFPFIKEVKDFDFDFQPSINKAQILEFESLGFIDKKENIVFLGPSGVHEFTVKCRKEFSFHKEKKSFSVGFFIEKRQKTTTQYILFFQFFCCSVIKLNHFEAP